MFNKDFYPTPREVVVDMIKEENLIGSIVLEPSAGKGNIVTVLQEFGVTEVLTCEIIEEFQPWLQQNSTFLKPDFMDLKPEDVAHVNFIIMNPPFSKIFEHVHHAFNIAPPGCTIISLANHDVVEQARYWEWREHRDNEKELKKMKRAQKRKEKLDLLITQHGFLENMGSVFENAERKTKVEIARIVLFKDFDKDGINFDVYMDYSMDDDGRYDGVMKYDEVRECVSRYVGAVNKFNAMYEQIAEMNKCSEVFGDTKLSLNMTNSKGNHITLGEYKRTLQIEAWKWIFDKLNMRKYQTTKLREKMNKYILSRSRYPFTRKNIFAVLDVIIQTHGQRMLSTLTEAFDTIISYSDENRAEYEGWKTNSAYKVNKNFIIPYICRGYEEYVSPKRAYPYVRLNYHYSDDCNKIDDIYKALCHMLGMDYDRITGFSQFMRMWDGKMQWGKWYENCFFKFRCYKKGTIHFQFVRDEVWEQFNREVARLKGWAVPEKTDGKTTGKERSKTSGVARPDDIDDQVDESQFDSFEIDQFEKEETPENVGMNSLF